jgi:hypothetical protein
MRMRIRLSDATKLPELRGFLRSVRAVAEIDGDILHVHLPGPERATDRRQLHAYLDTWLKLRAARGVPFDAEIESD